MTQDEQLSAIRYAIREWVLEEAPRGIGQALLHGHIAALAENIAKHLRLNGEVAAAPKCKQCGATSKDEMGRKCTSDPADDCPGMLIF